ncbi:MAG TPA: metal-dependent hydrolase [Actinomycetota bacterium]|nr:metal-dependent hydrolase [Actinomycetota bacterium]
MQLPSGTTITWLGHSTFLVETGGGKRILVDPWVQGNPACPDELKDVGDLDVLLITHGHFDHISDAVQIATEKSPQVVCIAETAAWLGSKGVENVIDMNKGGTVEVAGCRAHMVHAVHSCGITDGDTIVYGGEAAGFVVELEDGFRLYHAGDTAVFSDMALIGRLLEPDVALLPIGDHYTMGPRSAAEAVRLLGVKTVIPMHFGTFPVLTGRPDDLRREASDVDGLEVVDLSPGGRVGG